MTTPAGDVGLPAQLRRLIMSYQVSQVIDAAARLGIADLLTDAPRTSDELAAQADCHAPSLYRLLRALAALGVLEESEDGHFALTELGTYLRTDVPGSMRAYATLLLEPWFRQPWAELLQAVKSGREAFESVHGARFFEYLGRHPDLEPSFNSAMSSNAWMRANGLVAAYDLSGIQTLVDVGGGAGGLITAVLTAYPAMRGVIFDRPAVIAGTRQRLRAAGVAERCDLIEGDFFMSVPAGGQAYVLSAILHDFDDHDAVEILRSCRRVMGDGARLLVIEEVISPGNAPDVSKFDDLHMFVLTGGRERTARQFQLLFEAAGFDLARVIATDTPWSVIEGLPV